LVIKKIKIIKSLKLVVFLLVKLEHSFPFSIYTRHMTNLLDDVMGYSLDEEQRKVVYSNEKHVLVVAGAGSGKSLTIIGKVRYLIEVQKLPPSEILCISFTHASCESLKNKILKYYGYDLEVYTFHKLALEIIKKNSSVPLSIAPSDLLEYTISEYFYGLILENDAAMLRILKYFKIRLKKDILFTYQEFLVKHSKELLEFQKLLGKFLRLFKGQGFDVSKFYSFSYQNRKKNWFFKKTHNDLFFMIAWDIYLVYEKELRSTHQLDFDDMILQATSIVQQQFSKHYQYIIIDEYQDTSQVRFLLIQEILKQTNANLLVVGDDFQSIYQFAGSNLQMFLNFSQQFSHVATYKITHTYRNSQQLIDLAGNFIMKNPRQIQKQLKSSKSLEHPVELYYTVHPRKTLKKILEILSDKNGDILVLGRNNRDILPLLDNELTSDSSGKLLYSKFPNLEIQYLTIHKSKGLEADFVILVHVVEDILGLPSYMEDDPILKYVLEKQEYYPFEEERRLFYVALTRTKNKVYILSNKKQESRFLKELTHDLKSSTYNEV